MGWKTNWHGDHDETAPWTPSTSLRGNLIHPGPAVSGRENGPAPGSLTARGRLEGLVHSSSSLTESEKNETLPSLHKLSELREQLQHQMEVLKQSSRPIESMLQTEGSYSSSRESVRTKRLRQQAGFGEPFRVSSPVDKRFCCSVNGASMTRSRCQAPQIVVDAREELRLRFDTAAVRSLLSIPPPSSIRSICSFCFKAHSARWCFVCTHTRGIMFSRRLKWQVCPPLLAQRARCPKLQRDVNR